MSSGDVELVRVSVDGWVRTGDPQWHTITDDVRIVDHDLLDAGEYRGREGFERWMSDWSAAWSRFRMVPQEFIDVGDGTVVVYARMKATGRGSTVPVERDDALLYRVRDGLIAQLDYFNNRSEALAAAEV